MRARLGEHGCSRGRDRRGAANDLSERRFGAQSSFGWQVPVCLRQMPHANY